MTTQTLTYDRQNFPRVQLTKDDIGFSAIIDSISGLAPDRSVSPEEIGKGILSLDPPTVEADTMRELIDRSMLAVSLAVEATIGTPDSIAEVLAVRYRTGIAVRGALSALGEDI